MKAQFFCPKCLCRLIKKNNNFICIVCQRKYPVKNKIPIFSNLISEKEFGLLNIFFEKKILKYIQKHGTDKLLEFVATFFPETAKRMNNYLLKIYSYLTLDKKQNALEIGCGYGNLIKHLCNSYRMVYGVDLNITRLKICKAFLEASKIKNFKIICTDAFNLPFKDDFFDAIFLIGVFEWIPELYKTEPKLTQMKLLRYLYRKLSDKGKLIIGIENRYGIQYFLGRKDHSGLPFTSLMPRFCANIISKFIKHGPYKTYTYSALEYTRILHRCGFKKIKIYMALRSYRFPRFVISLDKTQIKYFFSNIFIESNKLEKLAAKIFSNLPFPFQRLLAPHFIIVAEK